MTHSAAKSSKTTWGCSKGVLWICRTTSRRGSTGLSTIPVSSSQVNSNHSRRPRLPWTAHRRPGPRRLHTCRGRSAVVLHPRRFRNESRASAAGGGKGRVDRDAGQGVSLSSDRIDSDRASARSSGGVRFAIRWMAEEGDQVDKPSGRCGSHDRRFDGFRGRRLTALREMGRTGFRRCRQTSRTLMRHCPRVFDESGNVSRLKNPVYNPSERAIASANPVSTSGNCNSTFSSARSRWLLQRLLSGSSVVSSAGSKRGFGAETARASRS